MNTENKENQAVNQVLTDEVQEKPVVEAAVASDDAARRAPEQKRNDFFEKVQKDIKAGISLADLKTMLEDDLSGFDIATVQIGGDEQTQNHASLLQAALIGGNLEVFQWLVEEKGLSIEECISCKDLKFNPAAPERNNGKKNGAREILAYIDEKTDVAVKNKIGLIVMASYYEDADLVKKLMSDPGIDINVQGRRYASAVSIAHSNVDEKSQEITEALMSDSRVDLSNSGILVQKINFGEIESACKVFDRFGHQFSRSEIAGEPRVGNDNSAFRLLVGVIANTTNEDLPKKNKDITALTLRLLAASKLTQEEFDKYSMYFFQDENGQYNDAKTEIFDKFGKAYLELTDEQKEMSAELIASGDPLVKEMMGVITDPAKLDDLVTKLDGNKEFREQFRKLHDEFGVFPLNVVNDQLVARENSRGFIGKLFKPLQERFFPVKVDHNEAVVKEMDAVKSNPWTWRRWSELAAKNLDKAKKAEHEVAVAAARKEDLEKYAGPKEEFGRDSKKTSREMYQARHRDVVTTSPDAESTNRRLKNLKQVGLEYDRTLRKIQTTQKHVGTKTDLHALNEMFFTGLASPKTLDEDKSSLIKGVRKAYLDDVYTRPVADRIEAMYELEDKGFSASQVEKMQSNLQKNYMAIQKNKGLNPDQKNELVGQLLQDVDEVLRDPKGAKQAVQAMTKVAKKQEKGTFAEKALAEKQAAQTQSMTH